MSVHLPCLYIMRFEPTGSNCGCLTQAIDFKKKCIVVTF